MKPDPAKSLIRETVPVAKWSLQRFGAAHSEIERAGPERWLWSVGDWLGGDRGGMSDVTTVDSRGLGPRGLDWQELRDAATRAAALAYCPYSELRVGAAAVVDDGRIITGCNVENGSYGLSLCAECTLVGQLRLTGGGRFVGVACRSGGGELLMPCGRCRQILYELGGPRCSMDTPRGVLPMSDVLPDAFEL